MPTSRESLITVLYGSTATGAPTDLYDGEFAFANASGTGKKLFIGSGGNNTSNWIGAVIEDQSTINWSSVTSENNKLPTQYAVKSLAANYLPLAGGSMTGDITLGVAAEINFTATGGGGGTIKIQAPAATTGNGAFTFTLPVNDGGANEVLTTDGNGVLSWASAGTATNVSVTDDDTSTTAYIAFTTATSGATGIKVDSDGITYNAATDTLALAGDIAVNGGDITTTSTGTATVFNTNATTVNMAGAGTTVSIGAATGTTTINNANTVVTGDLAVNGADITTTSTGTATVFNTNATTLNLGGVATAITMGATSGTTTTIRGGTLVGNTTTQNLFNTTATTLNIGGAATAVSIGASSGSISLNNPTINLYGGATTFQNVGIGSSHVTLAPDGEIRLTPGNTGGVGAGGSIASVVIQNLDTGAGQVQVTGGDLYLGRTTANGIAYSSSQIIFEGATNDGFETFVTVTDPTADRTITLPNATGTVALVAGSDTQVMFNDGGSALGGDSGLTYNKTTDSLTITGDLAVNGSDITTSGSGTATLFNTNALTLNLGGAATAMTMGDATTSTVTIRGGTLVGNTTTQNLFNTTATTVNFAGAATGITMGDSTTATTTIRGGTLVGNTTTQNLFNTTATTLNLGGAATTLSIGAATGTATINNANTVVTGDLAVNGGDITTSAATATIFNANATTITMGAAATSFTAAGAAGAQTVTIGGSSTAASTYNFGTGTTATATTKTVNIGTGGASGSTTNVNIGSVNGGTVAIGYNATIGNDLTVTGNLTVSGDTVTQNVSTLTVEDPLIKLASNNTATDALDIGFYGTYDTSGSQDLFCGLFRDATDGKFRLFVDSQSEPTTTVNTGATGYAVATLVANIRGGTFS